VTLAGSLIRYTPPGVYSGMDSFTYLVTDTRSASASGVVVVTVLAADAIILNSLGTSLSNNGTFKSLYAGNPKLTYAFDRAETVTGPWESGFTNLTADTNGLFNLEVLHVPAVPAQYFRARYP
jgi:hypothetical protein